MQLPFGNRPPTSVAGLIGLVLGCGCSSQAGTEHEPATDRQRLTPSVSAPFDVEATPTATPAATQEYTRIVCGSLRCLQVLTEYNHGPFVYAVAVDATGTAIAPRTFVGHGTLRAVAANGDLFLVALDETVYLIDGATGTLTVTATLPSQTTPVVQIAGTGATWAVVTSDDQSTSGNVTPTLYLLDATKLTVAATTPIANYPSLYAPTGTVGGPNQYLLWTDGKAWRVDATSGALLDSTAPITLSKYKSGLTSIVYVRDHYQILWRTATDIYSARLGTDGVMIDADDDFNQLTGGRLLCSSCADDHYSMGSHCSVFVTYDGTTLLGAWGEGNLSQAQWYLSHTKLDATTGLALESPIPYAEVSDQPVELANNARLILMRDQNNRVSVMGVASDTGKWTAVQTPIASLEGTDRVQPMVAFGGNQFLIAWINDGALYGTRINEDTGAYLDNPPLTIATDVYGGGIGSVGSDFVAMWRSHGSGLSSRTIHADGTLGASTRTSLGTSYTGDGTYFTVAGNGSVALGVWSEPRSSGANDILALRADATGPLTPDGASTPIITVKSGSGPLGIVADTVPTPDRRTFGVYQTSSKSFVMNRLRAQTGALVTPEYYDSSFGSPLVMASDGTSMLAAGMTSGGGISAVLIDPVSGSATTTAPVVLAAGPSAVPPVLAWFDGRAYVLMTLDTSRTYDMKLRRFTPDLKGLDASDVLFQASFASAGTGNSVAAAADGSGRSLVAYTQPDPQFHSMSIKARFVDDDGQRSATTGGSGGTFGGGGVSGTATAATTAGGTGTSGGTSAANVAGAATTSTAGNGTAIGSGGAGTSAPATGGLTGNATTVNSQAGGGSAVATTGGTSNAFTSAANGGNGGTATSLDIDDVGGSSGIASSPTSTAGSGSGETGGCGCRMLGAPTRTASSFAIALVSLVLARYRTTRRRHAPTSKLRSRA